MPVLIGTSGWQYADWAWRFHQGVPKRRWFEHTMTWFRTTELNVSFYRLPPLTTFQGWRARSPDDAIITVKASRYLTHIKRLVEPAEPVARLMGRADGLGPKLGPILVQLPPTLPVDVGALARTLDAFPAGTRVAVEVRHESWWTDEVRQMLEEKRACWVWVDRGGQPWGPLWRTVDWGYLRLHWGDAHPSPNYHRDSLAALGTPLGGRLGGLAGLLRLLQQRRPVRGGGQRDHVRRGGPLGRPDGVPGAGHPAGQLELSQPTGSGAPSRPTTLPVSSPSPTSSTTHCGSGM